MNGNRNHQPFDFNRRFFEQFFGGNFPPMDKLDISWVEKYVGDVLKQVLPQGMMVQTQEEKGQQIFETHHSVIAKIPLPPGVPARAVKVFVRMDRVKLEGFPDGKDMVVPLPCPVYPKSCRAVLKNGVLQLQMRKLSDKEPYTEIPVRII